MTKSNLLNCTNIMNCGMACTVIEDNGYKDLTVKFEDGTIVKHVQRSNFKNHSVSNPNLGKSFTRSLNTSILGNSKIMNNGMKCVVIEDNGSSDITVKFADGYIKKSNRNDFKRGCIKNDNFLKGIILGETQLMNCGMKCTVIEDNGSMDISVKFEDGTIISNIRREYFKRKTIANPNIGLRATVKNKSSIKGKSALMNCGMECKVIEDNGFNNITVKFEDGTIVSNTSRASFNNKSISNPKLGRGYANKKRFSLLGQKNTMSNGMICEVIEDAGSKNIVVKFEDGTIVNSNRYDFTHGNIYNENCPKGNILGQSAIMNCGMKCTVIEDKGSRKLTVKFEDGTVVNNIKRYDFINKSIPNPNLGKKYARIFNSSIKGQKAMMKNGLLCEVIEDNGVNNIIVKFEDGLEKKSSRKDFINKSITNSNLGRGFAYSLKNSIVGQTKLMRCGMKCTVIDDKGGDNITVEFEDGTKVENKTRYSFNQRSIINPKLMNMSSMPQRLLYHFISKYYQDIIQNYRPNWLKNENTNSNMEIDIWIPSLKIGIEYDGVAWHKEENSRSIAKYNLIKNSNEIDTLITILEKGAVIHESKKHYNILLNATSDTRERNIYIKEMEKAIIKTLKEIGIKEKVVITDQLLEDLYNYDIVRVSSPNLIRGENDLETVRPDLAEEWDYNKNKFLPSDVTKGSGKEVWWICSKCSYSWSARILNRARLNGTGCPRCNPKSQVRKILNVEKQKIYNSVSQASNELGIKKELIFASCKGDVESAGGYHWKYLDDKR